jgi:hypothetical protein
VVVVAGTVGAVLGDPVAVEPVVGEPVVTGEVVTGEVGAEVVAPAPPEEPRLAQPAAVAVNANVAAAKIARMRRRPPTSRPSM